MSFPVEKLRPVSFQRLYAVRKRGRWWDGYMTRFTNRHPKGKRFDHWSPRLAMACHFITRAAAAKVAKATKGTLVELVPVEAGE